MKAKTIEFEGYPCGDCECYCVCVDKKIFKRIKGRKPEKYDGCVFHHKGLYRLYPLDGLTPFPEDGNKYKFKISVGRIEKTKG